MLAALLLPVALARGATDVPAATRLEAELSASLTARRLLAADAGVVRRETQSSDLPLAVDETGGASPEIVVDLQRLAALPAGEGEAQYARALARAAVASPVPLVEAEQASRQWTAQVLVEAAAGDAALSRSLRAAELKPAPGAPVLGGAALFTARFESDPRSAYWAVESGPLPPETARLTDLEDLFTLRAAEVRALKEAPAGPYGELSGRRYPGRLIRAAYRLRAPGTLERLRESLGAYDTVGTAPFAAAINRWRRSLLPR